MLGSTIIFAVAITHRRALGPSWLAALDGMWMDGWTDGTACPGPQRTSQRHKMFRQCTTRPRRRALGFDHGRVSCRLLFESCAEWSTNLRTNQTALCHLQFLTMEPTLIITHQRLTTRHRQKPPSSTSLLHHNLQLRQYRRRHRSLRRHGQDMLRWAVHPCRRA